MSISIWRKSHEYIYLVESGRCEKRHCSLPFGYCHPVDFSQFKKFSREGQQYIIFEHGSYDGEYRLCYQNWSALDFLESHSMLLDKMWHFVGHMQSAKISICHLKSFYSIGMRMNMLSRDTMNALYFYGCQKLKTVSIIKLQYISSPFMGPC